jgi:hypothetical protein
VVGRWKALSFSLGKVDKRRKKKERKKIRRSKGGFLPRIFGFHQPQVERFHRVTDTGFNLQWRRGKKDMKVEQERPLWVSA